MFLLWQFQHFTTYVKAFLRLPFKLLRLSSRWEQKYMKIPHCSSDFKYFFLNTKTIASSLLILPRPGTKKQEQQTNYYFNNSFLNIFLKICQNYQLQYWINNLQLPSTLMKQLFVIKKGLNDPTRYNIELTTSIRHLTIIKTFDKL